MDGAKEVADAIRYAARWLGTNDAGTAMGALEWVGACIKEAGESIAHSVGSVATSIENMSMAIDGLAGAMGDVAEAVKSAKRGTTDTTEENH